MLATLNRAAPGRSWNRAEPVAGHCGPQCLMKGSRVGSDTKEGSPADERSMASSFPLKRRPDSSHQHGPRRPGVNPRWGFPSPSAR